MEDYKYRRRKKRPKNRKFLVKELRMKNPFLTLDEIGKQFDISRERVRQILTEAGLPTIHIKQSKIVTCVVCNGPSIHKRFCSPSCQEKFYYEFIPCLYCGKEKKILKSIIKRLKNKKKEAFCTMDHYKRYRIEKKILF